MDDRPPQAEDTNAPARDLAARCRDLIDDLDHAQGWGIDAAVRERYLSAIVGCLPNNCPDALISRTIQNYHADHALIEALSDNQHPGHSAAWDALQEQIIVVLRRAGLAWTRDQAYDVDDLAQMARLEVARSLAQFRYASRATTWVYQVSVQRIQRFIRDQQAQKRAGAPSSLDELAEPNIPIRDDDHPESTVIAQALAEQIQTILAAHPDPRVERIFQLWAFADLRVEDIGAVVQLHPSRVRALLALARRLLREHPAIRAWYQDKEVRSE